MPTATASIPSKVDSARELPVQAKPQRLVSLDAYRGLTMVLLASEALRLHDVAKNFPHSHHWQIAAWQLDHVQWSGGVLWDMIQPSFMFMVGVALPFSIASRLAKGQSFARMLLHAIWRSVLLVALGVFLTSIWSKQTDFEFTNVLCQIGLGYTFLFLLAWLKTRWQAVAAVAILLADWIAFAVDPRPGPGFDFTKYGVPVDWPHHLNGFASHWDKESNIVAAVDRWFLNLFPRDEAYKFSKGGYHTLNFVPSLATMIFGLLAGGLLKSARSAVQKLLILFIAGLVGVGVGWTLDALGVCPIVKRIWTPSWAVYAGGWTCLTLALFYLVIDVAKQRWWTLPLVVVGMNSIAIYSMGFMCKSFIRSSVQIHLGRLAFFSSHNPYYLMREEAVIFAVLWLICFWMYRRKIFLKI